MSFEGPSRGRAPRVKGRAAGRSYLALLSVTLSHRLFRPRAKAASSSRTRCSHSRSSARLGDVRMDSNRTCSYPLLVEACADPTTQRPPQHAAHLTVDLPTWCATTAFVQIGRAHV